MNLTLEAGREDGVPLEKGVSSLNADAPGLQETPKLETGTADTGVEGVRLETKALDQAAPADVFLDEHFDEFSRLGLQFPQRLEDAVPIFTTDDLVDDRSRGAATLRIERKVIVPCALLCNPLESMSCLD